MDDSIIGHESKYIMWMNRKQVLMPSQLFTPSMVRGRSAAVSTYHEYESWEERAFAEDAARGIGGFIWPPRSYTCSFCRREFKSAQALGGHMNVHRRDRAKLKQALSPTSIETMRHESSFQHAAAFATSENSPNAAGDQMKKEISNCRVSQTEQDKELHVSTNLCMGLRLDEVGNNKCKRLKSAGNIILLDHRCLSEVQSSSPLHHGAAHQGGLIQTKMSLMEELDLELRLGV